MKKYVFGIVVNFIAFLLVYRYTASNPLPEDTEPMKVIARHLSLFFLSVLIGIQFFSIFLLNRKKKTLAKLEATEEELRLAKEDLSVAKERIKESFSSLFEGSHESPDIIFGLGIYILELTKEDKSEYFDYEATLARAGITENSLEQLKRFDGEYSIEKKAKHLSSRLGIDFSNVYENRNLTVFKLILPPKFPINIRYLLFAITDLMSAKEIIEKLKAEEAKTGEHTCFFIVNDEDVRSELFEIAESKSNRWVVPDWGLTNKLIIGPDPLNTLAVLCSKQLSLSQISPYRIGGGVHNESVFFGRRELISQIINRDPANYLMVGGRQVGKSTLLKAIERRYANNPQVECVYFTLSSQVLVPRLASLLKLDRTDDAEVFATQLDERIRESGQRFVFLVDEADRFIVQEKSHDYAILNVFRRLSEEGNCTFILTGFWQLYQHAVLDYQSPIRNFGELLQVGELEKFACTELVTQPMKTMNLSYANETLVEHIVDSCGQRANLIAIVCQYIVRSLPPQQRIIEAGDVSSALQSDELRRALSGWVVGETDQEQAYERMVVYSTISKSLFTTGELLEQAKKQGIAVDTLELDRTLSRLELSFVLGRQGGSWYYRVPLFVEYIAEDSPNLKLEAEWKRITNQN